MKKKDVVIHTYGKQYFFVIVTLPCLKVPKCEIFGLFDFNDFYVIKSL